MNTDGVARTIEILLVEDNPADVRLTQEAFKEAKVSNNLHIAKDGVEALEFLRRQGANAEVPQPDLILLDINMPRKNGLEALDEIKTDPALRHIPVIMLTTSAADEDIIKAYTRHANCYIRKPVELDRFFDIVREIEGFWLSIVQLPRLEVA